MFVSENFVIFRDERERIIGLFILKEDLIKRNDIPENAISFQVFMQKSICTVNYEIRIGKRIEDIEDFGNLNKNLIDNINNLSKEQLVPKICVYFSETESMEKIPHFSFIRDNTFLVSSRKELEDVYLSGFDGYLKLREEAIEKSWLSHYDEIIEKLKNVGDNITLSITVPEQYKSYFNNRGCFIDETLSYPKKTLIIRVMPEANSKIVEKNKRQKIKTKV